MHDAADILISTENKNMTLWLAEPGAFLGLKCLGASWGPAKFCGGQLQTQLRKNVIHIRTI